MITRLGLFLTLVAGFSAAGCSSVMSMTGHGFHGPMVYGGTRLDAYIIAAPFLDAQCLKMPDSMTAADRALFAGYAVLGLIDLPLSAACDTVLLPWSLALAFQKPGAEHNTEQREVNAVDTPSTQRGWLSPQAD